MRERTTRMEQVPQSLWKQAEEVIGRFEAAWMKGAAPAIDPFLPATGVERRHLLIELIHIDLEYRLKAGEAVRVETYLERYPQLAGDHPLILDLLDTEYRQRRRSDPGLTLADYERRFPGYSQELAERLRDESPAEPAPLPDSPAPKPSPTDHGSLSAELRTILAPPQASDEVGRLGPYRVLAEIGHGGMGVVFRAEDPQLQRTVAIKAMLPWVAAVPSARMRFLREARAVAAIRHNHIVTIFQVGEAAGTSFLVMEFLEGESLEARLEREQLPIDGEVVRIGREIAEGLEAAHERGLIHRDIKPGNIWLEGKHAQSQDPRLRSGSFDGERSELDTVGAIVGTPAYMAPEQAEGRRSIAAATCSVWAASCIACPPANCPSKVQPPSRSSRR